MLPGRDVSLAEKVAFLKQPDSYPARPERVEAIETHMAWVFLAGDHAYKMKKPVRLPYLDFSTLEARRRMCQLEIRLNRRLAPSIYLDVIALTCAAGRLQLSGAGAPVEWLVKMVRLPADRMLDRAIRDGTWRPHDIERVVSLLAAFYRAAPSEAITAEVFRRRFHDEIRESLSVLCSRAELRAAHDRIEAHALARLRFLQRERTKLDQRVAEGRIIEGHGDLRPEHVAERYHAELGV